MFNNKHKGVGLSMREWNNLNTEQSKYEYRGFLVNYTARIFDRRIKDYMYCSKVIMNNGKQNIISFDASGDSFEETKKKICQKIDFYKGNNEAQIHRLH